MATVQVPLTAVQQHSTSHIGIVRLAATTGAAAGLIFVLCWLGICSLAGIALSVIAPMFVARKLKLI